MTNHPRRARKAEDARTQQRMTAEQLADILRRSTLAEDRAAKLAGVSVATLRQYLDGKPIPLSASSMLCTACVILGGPLGYLRQWMPADVVAGIERAQARLIELGVQP